MDIASELFEGLAARKLKQVSWQAIRAGFPVSRSLGEENWETERALIQVAHFVNAASHQNAS